MKIVVKSEKEKKLVIQALKGLCNAASCTPTDPLEMVFGWEITFEGAVLFHEFLENPDGLVVIDPAEPRIPFSDFDPGDYGFEKPEEEN